MTPPRSIGGADGGSDAGSSPANGVSTTTTRTRRPRVIGAWLGLALAGALGASLGLAACFELPADDVTFSCDPQGASACPDGYRCEADGCCHRIGSDVSASLGACALGGGTGGGSDSDGSGDGGGSDSDGGSGSDSDTGATTG